ncbi:MAG: hypothetical protein LBU17_10740, partial [Treponema sp.]|nr:hypothetical protein [Treponema sp.]
MKKKVFFMGILSLVLVFRMALFVGCSSDDDDGGDVPQVPQVQQGTLTIYNGSNKSIDVSIKVLDENNLPTTVVNSIIVGAYDNTVRTLAVAKYRIDVKADQVVDLLHQIGTLIEGTNEWVYTYNNNQGALAQPVSSLPVPGDPGTLTIRNDAADKIIVQVQVEIPNQQPAQSAIKYKQLAQGGTDTWQLNKGTLYRITLTTRETNGGVIATISKSNRSRVISPYNTESYGKRTIKKTRTIRMIVVMEVEHAYE